MANHADHVVSRKIYFAVFFALLTLTVLTVVVARQDLGPLNTIAAMGIAATKAILVILFFMHVRYSTRLTKFVIGSGLLWLALLIGLVMMDYYARGWVR
jgi:cytochrome c oxidase subunit IV